MDAITKLKAEVFDIMVQIEGLAALKQEKLKLIMQLEQAPQPEPEKPECPQS